MRKTTSKSSVSPGDSVAQDIEHAQLRMIYENPAEYAEWRARMGLKPEPDGSSDPVMRARVNKLFRGLAGHLEALPWQSRGGWSEKPVERREKTAEELAREYRDRPPMVGAELAARVVGSEAAE